MLAVPWTIAYFLMMSSAFKRTRILPLQGNKLQVNYKLDIKNNTGNNQLGKTSALCRCRICRPAEWPKNLEYPRRHSNSLIKGSPEMENLDLVKTLHWYAGSNYKYEKSSATFERIPI
ncbi:hypothetical protein GJ496_001635 [Pomphorhynchus laevis]|nr:hypothetical protein GJ496_001635 [Pomphorhynchus laevis]